VAQAVKDAVGHAVREALQATLAEVLTNPDVLRLLRCAAAPPAPEGLPVASLAAGALPRPGVVKRLLDWVGGWLGACRDRIGSWLGACRQGIGGALGWLRRPLGLAWRLRGPVAVGAGPPRAP
jgi:hypothetical protein